MINETFSELRVWFLVLRSALEENDTRLAQDTIKEIVNILAEISYVYNLWDSSGKLQQIPQVKRE